MFAALNWEALDVVPFVPKVNYVPRDPTKLNRLKDMRMGLSWQVPVFREEPPNVTTEVKVVGNNRITVFHTPVGDVSEKFRINLPNEGGERGSTWRVEHMFKKTADYKIIRFIVQDKIYVPDYSDAAVKERELGGEGVVFTGAGRSPLMQLIATYMGFPRLAIELHRRPDQVEELMEAIDRKFEERVRIAAEYPVKLVHLCENIDGVLVNPKPFEKFIIPRQQTYNEILHERGKITMCHMDGRMKCSKELIRKTELDVVQAFTPPPQEGIYPEGSKDCLGRGTCDLGQHP